MARKYRNFVYDENQRFIYPTSDWGFKYLLGTEKHKDILLGILNELLPDLQIEDLEYLPRDITIPVGNMRNAKFDVFCKLRDGSRVEIEMQNYIKAAFLDRSTVYTAAAILDQYVNSRKDRYCISKTIFLAFMGDPLFKDVDRTPIRLSLCDVDEAVTTVRNDKVLQIFVELPKFTGSLKEVDEHTPFVEELAYVLMEMADCREIPDNLSPLLKSMFEAADTLVMDPDSKSNYMKSILGEAEYEANLYEWKAEGLSEGLAEGRAVGLAEGRAEGRAAGIAEGRAAGLTEGRAAGLTEGRIEGRAEGRAIGLAEGRDEGMEESARTIAATMKKEGVPECSISRYTGLNLEQIQAL